MPAGLRRLALSTALTMLVSLSSNDASASESWDRLLWKSIELREKGQFAESLKFANESLAAVDGANDKHLPEVLTQIGRIHSEQAHHAEAEPFFARALEVSERLHGKTSPRLDADLMYLAGNHVSKNELATAETLYLRLLKIIEGARGPQHVDLALPLRAMAHLHRRQGRMQDAERAIKRTMTLWQSPSATVLGVKFDGTPQDLQNLGALHADRGSFEDAIRVHEQALKLLDQDLEASREKWGSPGNGTFARSIECLERLARLSRRVGRSEAADGYERRAKALRSQMTGEPLLSSPRAWAQGLLEIAM